MRVGYYSCFFVWQGSAVVIFGQEYAAQDRLDISTNKLLQAFNLLLEDSGSARNQSMFSEQLAVAALNALRSVPEAFVRERTAKDLDTASYNEQLPNPDSGGCFSKNYSPLCPEKWYQTGDGKSCKATKDYKGSCGPTLDMSDATPLTKRRVETSCGVSWPCHEACKQDYRQSCPDRWETVGSICRAPTHYRGNCVVEKSFANFDEPSKMLWAQSCDVKWPCLKMNSDFSSVPCPKSWVLSVDGKECQAPPSYLGPCDKVQQIAGISTSEKRQLAVACHFEWATNFTSRFDFGHKCPLGWKQLINKEMSCEAPREYSGPCEKQQSFVDASDQDKYDFMISCGALWPVRDVVQRNYEAPCPQSWHLESNKTGICASPASYTGPCQSRYSFLGHTADMKRAFEGRCNAVFPVSALSSVPKLKPLALATQSNVKTGPIAGEGTPLRGTILEPNGTVYFPSKTWRTKAGPAPQLPHPASELDTKSLQLRHLGNLQAKSQDSLTPSVIEASKH